MNYKLTIICLGLMLTFSTQKSFAQSASQVYVAVNRTIEQLKENNRSVVRVNEAPGSGVVWVKGVTFSEGTIEFDVKGRDVFQKSFVGIAFHGADDQTYETVYFRPFNFQSGEPARKIHAVQYSFEPSLGFQQLRDTRKDEFESAILPATITATEWFHAKAEVRNGRIKVFVNDSKVPCLDVPTLNPGVKNGKIGFWVGNNSNGDFANLKAY
jgi:hypothetical protein